MLIGASSVPPEKTRLIFSRLPALFTTVLIFVTAGWSLIELLSPPVELTRFRNSLIAEIGKESDFDWDPSSIPADFRNELASPPSVILDAANRLQLKEQYSVPTMIALVDHLRSKPKKRGPIKSNTIFAYSEIISKGRGYCADYTQVFNGLSHAVDLPVREWGMSFDRFSGNGHAFSEVFDTEAGHWVFVDPMRGFFVRDSRNLIPLSALEFRRRLVSDNGFQSIQIVPIGQAFMFKSGEQAFDYYRDGADQFYLYFANDVFSYDNHPLVKFFGPISRALEQLTAIIAGIHPEIRVYLTPENTDEYAALQRLKYGVLALASLMFLAVLLASYQIVAMLRSDKG